MLEAALAYAEVGWPVFPCRYKDKSPATAHGFKDATTNLNQIRNWWSTSGSHPYNIGIAVPKEVIVVDFDGPDSWNMAKDHLPPTAISITPREGTGRHYWYKNPNPDSPPRPHPELVKGIDLRSWGSYVLAPPSVHPSGGTYRWETSILDVALTDCPQWVLDEAKRKDFGNNEFGKPVGVNPIKILEGVAEGGRQVALWKYACYLRRKGIAQEEATVLVLAAAEAAQPPYREKSIPKMVERAWGRYPPGPQAVNERKIWKVNDLINTDLGKVKWFIHGILPQGVCIFTSDPKLGKSMIMANLAKQISSGQPAFGKYRTEPTGVLYLDLEMGEILSRERWTRIAQGERLSDDLDVVYSWDAIGNQGVEKLDNYLTDNPRVKMVIIDVLAKVWPQKDLSSAGTAYNRDYTVISKLGTLAKEHNACVVAIHHKSKDKDNRDNVMSASGSAGIVGASDTIWSLARDRDSKVGFLDVTGRTVEDRKILLQTDGFIWTA